jgi:LPXTG-site transpeptidase (sortase) family protein
VINSSGPGNRILTKIGWALALILALSQTGCNDIVRIVPIQTSTPVVTATLVLTPPPPAVTSGQPDHILAPAINLDAPVVEMGWRTVDKGGQSLSEWEMPDNEAAWHQNSARPGEGSNIVISGHNESTAGQVFARLDELQLGNEIILKNNQAESFTYRVIEKNIVRTFAISTEADQYLRSVTEPTTEEQLTLITCWPSWSNTHRLVIVAIPAINKP